MSTIKSNQQLRNYFYLASGVIYQYHNTCYVEIAKLKSEEKDGWRVGGACHKEYSPREYRFVADAFSFEFRPDVSRKR